MTENSVIGEYVPYRLPYIGDFPPTEWYPWWQYPTYPDPRPTIAVPNTNKPKISPYCGNGYALGGFIPSREQIEKELLQKIADELKLVADGNDYLDIWEWIDEIIEEYYVEPE